MKHFFKTIYGTGIIFFYYVKWFVFIGLPILYYGLEYKQNSIMNILWLYCFALIIKDFMMRFIVKKRFKDTD